MSTAKWKQENQKTYTVCIMSASGIPEVMEKYIADHKMSKNGFIQAAIREKLQAEGYLKAEYSGPKGKFVG